jgi:hypothetical protein
MSCPNLFMFECNVLLMFECNVLLMIECDVLLMFECEVLLMFECDVLLMLECDVFLIFEPSAVEPIAVENINVLMYGFLDSRHFVYDFNCLSLSGLAFKVTKISTKLVRTIIVNHFPWLFLEHDFFTLRRLFERIQNKKKLLRLFFFSNKITIQCSHVNLK